MKEIKNCSVFLLSAILFFVFFMSNSNAAQAPGDEAYMAFAEVMPEPIGGIEAIYKKIDYPVAAKNAGIEGKVYVLIFINETGGVDDVKVIKGIGGGCEDVVIDAVKDSKFKPAMNGGTPIKVKLSLAFTFKLK